MKKSKFRLLDHFFHFLIVRAPQTHDATSTLTASSDTRAQVWGFQMCSMDPGDLNIKALMSYADIVNDSGAFGCVWRAYVVAQKFSTPLVVICMPDICTSFDQVMRQ